MDKIRRRLPVAPPTEQRSEAGASGEDELVLDSFKLYPASLPNTFTAEEHYRKLRRQRHFLRYFGKQKELTMLNSEKNFQLIAAHLDKEKSTEEQSFEFKDRFNLCLPPVAEKRRVQRSPAGVTSILQVNNEDGSKFDLRANLKKLWRVGESRHVPGTLGVFARKAIPLDESR